MTAHIKNNKRSSNRAAQLSQLSCNSNMTNERDHTFQLCRSNKWRQVLARVKSEPMYALTPFNMQNRISTTILHQAITSKGDVSIRADVIRLILQQTPRAASIKNGYGSLPLHAIAQRNTKLTSNIKEELMMALVRAYPGALSVRGGNGGRTPLHILFTDYVSPELTQFMVDMGGSEACFMQDRNGYLPAHVACSRHCSPEKLGMLLAVNYTSLRAQTKDGSTLLSLATSTITDSHPNHKLIRYIQDRLEETKIVPDSHINSTRMAKLVTPATIIEANHNNKRSNSMSTTSSEGSMNSKYSIMETGVTPTKKNALYKDRRPIKKRRVDEERLPRESPVDLLLYFSTNRDSNLHYPLQPFDAMQCGTMPPLVDIGIVSQAMEEV